MAGRMRTRKSGLGGGGLLNGSTQTASRSMSFFAGRRTSDSLLALLLPPTLAYALLCTLRCLASPVNLGLNAGSRRLTPKRSMSKLSKQPPKKGVFWLEKPNPTPFGGIRTGRLQACLPFFVRGDGGTSTQLGSRPVFLELQWTWS